MKMFALFLLAAWCLTPDVRARSFNVADFGAAGDGVTSDTAAINRALAACASAGGGQVLIPPGRYLSGTIHLCSHLTLYLAPGAMIIGTTNLAEYQQPDIPASLPEAKWGKWHRALIVGQDLEDVTLIGPGTINGNKVYDPNGEEHRRGPHAINFVNCRHFTLRDLNIVDAANYAIFFQVSDEVEVRNVKITGGWDGVHFRGAPDRWCHGVRIIDCDFSTGDDSIAGRYWDDVIVSRCLVNSSCNGLRLIGPATRLLVEDCLFYGPGRRPHRTSGRTNMLSGIILQPGGWDRTTGPLDDVLLANNTMRGVASPVTIWTRPGNPVGRVTISGLNATGVYEAALSVESWSHTPITNVVLRDAQIEYTGGQDEGQTTRTASRPGVDVRPLPAWGIYLHNVQQFTCQDVRLSITRPDARPALVAERAGRILLDDFKYPPPPTGVTNMIDTNEVQSLEVR